jgi:hypothetical protein
MSKKLSTFLIIFLIVFGFLIFNFKKFEKVEAQTFPDKVFVAAMKTLTNGYFYVPHISAPMNPRWVRVMPLSTPNPNYIGDQTGGTNDYFTIVPDGTCGINDTYFITLHNGTSEGQPGFEYMADVNADGVINVATDKCLGSGNYVTDLTNVTILFKDSTGASLGEYSLDAQGFVSIPANAANFTVKKNGSPIGAYVYFYAQRPNLMGWAWSENIGWISLNSVNCNTDGDGKYEGSGEAIGSPPAGCPTSGQAYNYGVNVQGLPTDTMRDIIGYAWSDKIGWIKFDPPSPYPSGQPSNPTQFGAGTVYGWARACGAAPNPSTCGGGTGGNTVAGGWEGWINMTDAVPPSLYEVTVGDGDGYMEPGEEFFGWAWGGGGSDLSNAVIGWISWNCKNEVCRDPTTWQILDYSCSPTAPPAQSCVSNGGECHNSCITCNTNGKIICNSEGVDPHCSAPGTCVANNYKVTYQPVNQPPNIPSTSESIDQCCYGCVPQVAQGVSVTFSWTYSDLEGDPQTAYEIWVDNDSGFSDPKFNYLVVSSGSTAYTLNLSNDANGDWDPDGDGIPVSLDPDEHLLWGTTYYWKVGVTDQGSGQTTWSSIDSFPMPAHAAPYVNFSWCPQSPAVYQETQFCSVTEAGVCDAATCPPPTDETECYDAAGNVVNCANWSWVFTDATSPLDSTPPAEISGSTFEYQNPREIKFQSAGLKEVTLTVTDSAPTSYSCSASSFDKTPPGVQVGLPLPEWREIPPF